MRKRSPAGKTKPTCSKCGNQLEENRKGKYRYCRSCHASYMRAHRPKHSELKDHAKKKANARAYVKEYVRRGVIKKSNCAVCGSDNTEMHHNDYNKPLEVVWLCREYHLALHKSVSNG